MSAPLRTDEAAKAAGTPSGIVEGGARKPAVARQNGRWTAYWHLLGARLKEMKREPEVIFWVFLFPLLLAFGLGIAFRSRPASVPNVAIAAGPGADAVLQMAQRSPQSLHAQIVPEAEALDGFRLGRYDLVIIPHGDAGGAPRISLRSGAARKRSRASAGR